MNRNPEIEGFRPPPLTEQADGLVTSLAMEAIRDGVVILAGAGISVPSGIPDGRGIGLQLKTAAVARQYLRDGECEDSSLLCVADLIEQRAGLQVLEQLLPDTGDFRAATPNYGHMALALLVLEHAVRLIVTNWDDCVERSVPEEIRIEPVVAEADLQQVSEPRVYKVHGCITRRNSLLASNSQLAAPPVWVIHELGARLADSRIIFVGLGDVPDYVRIRIGQLLDHVPNLGHVIVAARSISPAWDDITRNRLVAEHKLEVDGRLFLARLVNAYVSEALAGLRAQGDAPEQRRLYEQAGIDFAAGLNRVLGILEAFDGCLVLRWIRKGRHRSWPNTRSIIHSTQMAQILTSIAVLSSRREPAFDQERMMIFYPWPDNRQTYVEFVCADGLSSAVIIRESYDRTSQKLDRGDYPPGSDVLVICEGQVGPMPARSLLRGVFAETLAGDLMQDAQDALATVIDAHSINNGQLPEAFAA